MRRCFLWLSVLVALPLAAGADDGGAAGWNQPAIEGADAVADASPLLDLSLDPNMEGQLSGVHQSRPVAPLATAARPTREPEAPFSLGIDIKTRRDMGIPASRATAEPDGPQTLTDKVEGVVRNSTFGVTGTYRF